MTTRPSLGVFTLEEAKRVLANAAGYYIAMACEALCASTIAFIVPAITFAQSDDGSTRLVVDDVMGQTVARKRSRATRIKASITRQGVEKPQLGCVTG
jgi:hypothetical protein